jgi:hypothetical protein
MSLPTRRSDDLILCLNVTEETDRFGNCFDDNDDDDFGPFVAIMPVHMRSISGNFRCPIVVVVKCNVVVMHECFCGRYLVLVRLEQKSQYCHFGSQNAIYSRVSGATDINILSLGVNACLALKKLAFGIRNSDVIQRHPLSITPVMEHVL